MNLTRCEFTEELRFQDFIDGCRWKDASSLVDLFNVQTIKQEQREQTAHTCSHEASGWTSYKIGPFFTYGNYSWTFAGGLFSLGSHWHYLSNHVYFIEQYMVGSIDDDANIIPYPPIHQHHFHVMQGSNAFTYGIHNHGDNHCTAQEGGAACYQHCLPAGYAFVLSDRLGFHMEFNDVRPATTSSLKSWALVALKRANNSLHVRQVLYDGSIGLSDPKSLAGRLTYRIRTQVESVLWSSGTWRKGKILEAYFHTHGEMVRDLWFFEGNSSEVFSDVRAALPKDSLSYSHGIIAATMDSIGLRQKEPGAAQITCTLQESQKLEDVELQSDHIMTLFRHGFCQHMSEYLNDWVLVVFHQARSVDMDTTYDMHVVLRILYESLHAANEQTPSIHIVPDGGYTIDELESFFVHYTSGKADIINDHLLQRMAFAIGHPKIVDYDWMATPSAVIRCKVLLYIAPFTLAVALLATRSIFSIMI